MTSLQKRSFNFTERASNRMSSMHHKAFSAAAVAAIALGGSLITAAPAQAVTSCPSSGYFSSKDVCTKLSNGILGHRVYYNGSNYTKMVVTDYYKSGGGTINRRLGSTGPFDGLSTQWGSWGNQSSGKTSSWSKKYNNSLTKCRSTQGLMETGGTIYKTPSASC